MKSAYTIGYRRFSAPSAVNRTNRQPGTTTEKIPGAMLIAVPDEVRALHLTVT